jgi:uncharacterized protein involved in tolerance to divalent cations
MSTHQQTALPTDWQAVVSSQDFQSWVYNALTEEEFKVVTKTSDEAALAPFIEKFQSSGYKAPTLSDAEVAEAQTRRDAEKYLKWVKNDSGAFVATDVVLDAKAYESTLDGVSAMVASDYEVDGQWHRIWCNKADTSVGYSKVKTA